MNRLIVHLICGITLVLAQTIIAGAELRAEQMKQVEFLGLASKLPASWQEEQPSSDMRLAQFVVPGGREDLAANLIVYYFGQGQGGSAEANINRWQSQFSKPGGGVVEPSIEKLEVSGMAVTVVELRGDYARGVGMGPAGSAAPDRILLASIVEAPRGNLYIQLHGPAATVSAQREIYLDFIRQIQRLPTAR